MENMRTIFMYINTLNIFTENITANMLSFFNYFNFKTSFFSFIGKTEPNNPEPTIR